MRFRLLIMFGWFFCQTCIGSDKPIQAHPVYTCPNDKVTFVVGVAEDMATEAVKEALGDVLSTARRNGFVVQKLYGAFATKESYLSWLACPKLRVFWNISHGTAMNIVLSRDTELTATYVKNDVHLRCRTLVFSYSCNGFNGSLKTNFVAAGAQRFIGSNTKCAAGGPDLSTAKCFWNKALEGKNITKALTDCKAEHKTIKLQIAGTGSDSVSPATTMIYTEAMMTHDEL